jgi:hypothetical protein
MTEVKMEITFGMEAVGYEFNPSGITEVSEIKLTFAKLIDKCNNIETSTYLGNTVKGMAIRACMSAQMAVVKFIKLKNK